MFVPGRPFQLSLMFVVKARGLHKSGESERCFTWVGSPTLKDKTRLERPDMDKHSSLFWTFVNYNRKIFKHGPRTELALGQVLQNVLKDNGIVS